MTDFKEKKPEKIQLSSDALLPGEQMPALSASIGEIEGVGSSVWNTGTVRAEPAPAGRRIRSWCLFIATLGSFASVGIWFAMAISHNPNMISGSPDLLAHKYLLFVETMWIWFAELTTTVLSEGLQALIGPGWPPYLLPSVLLYLWSTGFYGIHAARNKQLPPGRRCGWSVFLLAGYGALMPFPAMIYWWKFLRDHEHNQSRKRAAD
jgi:hypothetical protein